VVLDYNGDTSNSRSVWARNGVYAGDGTYGISVAALFTTRTQHHDIPYPSAVLVSDAPYYRIPRTTTINLLDTYYWDLGAGDIWLLHYGTLCFSIPMES
jgi:hypothetical protein